MCGCLPQPTTPTAAKPAPAPKAENYTPYYTDSTLRHLRGDVIYSVDSYALLGRLNNLYDNQAQTLYETLGVAQLQISQLPVPDMRWVRVAFSTVTGERVETFTLYENNLVEAEHPTEGKQRCTAAPGTYEKVLAYLHTVEQTQSRYFAVEAEGIGEDGYHAAGYTLYDKKGKIADKIATGEEFPVAELVGDGLVQVTVKGVTRLYATATGQDCRWTTTITDIDGDRVAVADAYGVSVYTLFEKKPLCRIYVATTEDNPQPVQGLDFTGDGELHMLCRTAAGSVYDRTIDVAQERDGSQRRMVGEWRESLTPATEKEEQVTGYRILQKLRHKEKDLGYMLSGILLGHLQVEDTDYLLCELGHWLTNEEGGVAEYEVVGCLMVPADQSVGYEATLEDNELYWDTAKDWFKK